MWSQDPVCQNFPAFIGQRTEEILRFTWPTVMGEADELRMWAAMLKPGMSELFGKYSVVDFGYGPGASEPTPTPEPTFTPTSTAVSTPQPTTTGTPAIPDISIEFMDETTSYPSENCTAVEIYCFPPRGWNYGCSDFVTVAVISNEGNAEGVVNIELVGEDVDFFENNLMGAVNIPAGDTVEISCRFCPGTPIGMKIAELIFSGSGIDTTLTLKAEVIWTKTHIKTK